MSEALLNVEKRERVNKKENKLLRREGKVPGIYYIHGEDSIPLAVDEKQLKSIIHSESSIIDLSFNDKKKAKCVIRDIQWDPVAGNPLHVDFMGIKLTEKVTVDIPVHLVGTAVGVKNSSGILQHILREISIECLPLDIPEHLEVDVTNLDIGDALRIEDFSIDKVKILNDPSQSIVTVTPPKVAEEPVEEIVEEEITEPEVVSEKKEEEEVQD